jgi:hypothetical protein
MPGTNIEIYTDEDGYPLTDSKCSLISCQSGGEEDEAYHSTKPLTSIGFSDKKNNDQKHKSRSGSPQKRNDQHDSKKRSRSHSSSKHGHSSSSSRHGDVRRSTGELNGGKNPSKGRDEVHQSAGVLNGEKKIRSEKPNRKTVEENFDQGRKNKK